MYTRNLSEIFLNMCIHYMRGFLCIRKVFFEHVTICEMRVYLLKTREEYNIYKNRMEICYLILDAFFFLFAIFNLNSYFIVKYLGSVIEARQTNLCR